MNWTHCIVISQPVLFKEAYWNVQQQHTDRQNIGNYSGKGGKILPVGILIERFMIMTHFIEDVESFARNHSVT
jgi:hypothetical protein